MDKCFVGTASRIGGCTFEILAAEVIEISHNFTHKCLNILVLMKFVFVEYE